MSGSDAEQGVPRGAIETTPRVRRPPTDGTLPMAFDVAFGLTRLVAGRARGLVRAADAVGRPLLGPLLRPPVLPRGWWPATHLAALAGRGRSSRRVVRAQAEAALDLVVPAVLEALLARIDVTAAVLRHVDVARLVRSVDLNAMAASIELEPIVDRVPVDRVLERVDLDAVVASVDLQPVIDRVLDQVDVDAIVATVDLQRVIDRIDVDAVVARVDVEAVVERVDLVGRTREVLDQIDLPGIIRESSGAMASETVVGVRTHGIEADERVNRIVDRILLRRRERDTAPSTGQD